MLLVDRHKVYNAIQITRDKFGVLSTEIGQVMNQMLQDIPTEMAVPDDLNNITNGDMIEAVFAIKEIHAMVTTIFVVLCDGQELEFNREWWFSSYKALTILKEPE